MAQAGGEGKGCLCRAECGEGVTAATRWPEGSRLADRVLCRSDHEGLHCKAQVCRHRQLEQLIAQ